MIENIRVSPSCACGVLFAVADGLSGHIGGGKASKIATESLLGFYRDKSVGSEHDSVGTEAQNLIDLQKAIFEIHMRISALSDQVDQYKYLGTTLSVFLVCNMLGLIGHVGDSRIYLLRDGHLVPLTHDDTVAQLSVEMGFMEDEQALHHPLRHALTQALGQGVDEVQTKAVRLEPGDIFLLCTDGLYDMVSENEILLLLKTEARQSTVCDLLVERALINGGKDDVTVVVVEFPRPNSRT